jgi:hypothetical protein
VLVQFVVHVRTVPTDVLIVIIIKELFKLKNKYFLLYFSSNSFISSVALGDDVGNTVKIYQ